MSRQKGLQGLPAGTVLGKSLNLTNREHLPSPPVNQLASTTSTGGWTGYPATFPQRTPYPGRPHNSPLREALSRDPLYTWENRHEGPGGRRLWALQALTTVCEIDNPVPLHSTGTCVQYPVVAYSGKKYGQESVYVHD